MLRPQTEAEGSITVTEKEERKGGCLSKREHPSTLQLPYRVQPHRMKIGARKNLGSCVFSEVPAKSSPQNTPLKYFYTCSSPKYASHDYRCRQYNT